MHVKRLSQAIFGALCTLVPYICGGDVETPCRVYGDSHCHAGGNGQAYADMASQEALTAVLTKEEKAIDDLHKQTEVEISQLRSNIKKLADANDGLTARLDKLEAQIVKPQK